MPFCAECGQEYTKGTKFCSQCGSSLIKSKQEKSKVLDDFTKSLNNSDFSRRTEFNKIQKLLEYKTTEELREIAEKHQIELTKGLIFKKEVEDRNEVIEIFIGSEMSFNFLYDELKKRFENTPFSDVSPETVNKFRLLYDEREKKPGYLSNSKLSNGNWVYLYVNKVDMLLYREFFLLALNERDPISVIKDFTIKNQRLAGKIPYITIGENTYSTDNIIKGLITLGRQEIRVYIDGTSTYLINLQGEIFRLEVGEKKPSGLSLNDITASTQTLDVSEDKLDRLIEIIDEIDLLDNYHSIESAKTESATFPSNVNTLVDAWEREIKYWQDTYIEYMDMERKAWEEIKTTENLPQEIFALIHTLQVNLSYAISERKKNVENYKEQLQEMKAYQNDSNPRHHHNINTLLEDQLKWSKAKRRLLNDYSEILIKLVNLGLKIPLRIIPEIKPINEEDYELSNYIIKKVLMVEPPILQQPYDPNYVPWITEYEQYQNSLMSYDEKLAAMDQISATSDWYLDMTRKMREEKYSS
ncbi:MAG: zinc-ribbon domain-containing protein [Promethearchaeota archaeon]|jgi:hypothetical protein